MDVPPTTLARTLLDHLNDGDLDAMRPHAAEDEGKVASVFAAYDSADFAVQVGLLPPIDSLAQRAIVHAINALTALRRLIRRR